MHAWNKGARLRGRSFPFDDTGTKVVFFRKGKITRAEPAENKCSEERYVVGEANIMLDIWTYIRTDIRTPRNEKMFGIRNL